MSEKLKACHLERGAYVYVRQSTPYQVRNNLESKARQYALEGRAQQLGFSKVVVIDEDLGRSGSGLQGRPVRWKMCKRPRHSNCPRPTKPTRSESFYVRARPAVHTR